MRFDTLLLDLRPPLAEIRLNRTDRGNPIDGSFLNELERATAVIHDDDSVHAVLLTAAGDVFSRGWDATAEPPPTRSAPPFRCLELTAQPVIAVIEGEATGAGLELALACDMRLAATVATFALPDVANGTMPSAGATQRLPRLVGRAKAIELILLGEPLTADAAFACGLVNVVAPAGQARERAEALASTIASRGPIALRYAKEAILRGLDMPLDQALRYETDLTIILQTTSDRAEGVQAFLEKRPPRFEGR
jgi:enoyl-CoA hydratase/carnithine racemase